MDWLNYHHLHYFWMIAREGTIARACEKLRLAQPTLSGQMRLLENALGEKLFARKGRTLELTDVGRVVFRYAEEIFSLGRELTDTLKGRPTGQPMRLFVGVADVVPKLIAYRLLEPALSLGGSIQIVCREDKPDRLMVDLSQHHLDLVLSDSPAPASVRVRAFSHLLGSCSVSLFATPALAARYRRKYPASLEGAPFLLPAENTMLRRALDHWFEAEQIRPEVVGEFEDSA